jgi:putative glutathione S-transferase
MVSATDVSNRSDIGQLKTSPDGSFKRTAARFRNFIENDGKFLPEMGKFD